MDAALMPAHVRKPAIAFKAGDHVVFTRKGSKIIARVIWPYRIGNCSMLRTVDPTGREYRPHSCVCRPAAAEEVPA